MPVDVKISGKLDAFLAHFVARFHGGRVQTRLRQHAAPDARAGTYVRHGGGAGVA
jgi:hypothetical protein